MPDELLTPEQAMAILAATASRIAAVSTGVLNERLQVAPGPDEWSANEVLAHLRSCEDVWGNSIRRVLAEDNPTIRAVSPRTWIRRTDYPSLDFHDSLRTFAGQRAGLLADLERLIPTAWQRTATAVGAGKPFVHTVQSYAHQLATHERSHVKQIECIVATLRA